jgi:hypothetical protein
MLQYRHYSGKKQEESGDEKTSAVSALQTPAREQGRARILYSRGLRCKNLKTKAWLSPYNDYTIRLTTRGSWFDS